jgi:hypothetical protein
MSPTSSASFIFETMPPPRSVVISGCREEATTEVH